MKLVDTAILIGFGLDLEGNASEHDKHMVMADGIIQKNNCDNGDFEDVIKLKTERDTYKAMYENVIEKVVWR